MREVGVPRGTSVAESPPIGTCVRTAPTGATPSETGAHAVSAQVDGTRARLFAGCGIVADSDPAAELAEARTKFRAMQYALQG